MTTLFDETTGEALGRPERYSQVAQLLKAMATSDALPLAVRWEKGTRHVIVRGRKRHGRYPTLIRVYDAEFRRAAAAGWIAEAADPPNGTWMLTARGKAVLEALS